MRARAALALLGLLLLAQASAGERIERFETEIRLHGDDTFTVHEKIRYDFGPEQRRGIFRDIPIRYGRGRAADYRIGLDVEAVTDELGSPRPYALSRRGDSQRIRIGDPDVRVSGIHEYWIRYRVARGVLWFEDRDELYWNATGTEWTVPIVSTRVSVTLPDGGFGKALETACFTGPRGSFRSDCTARADGEVASFATNRGLGPGEGLSVAVGLPKGLLAEPSSTEKWMARARDTVSAWFVLPLLALGGLTFIWRRRGRDPVGRGAIPVRYEPPEGLLPAEVGTLIDKSVDIRDVTSTILNLAVRGHLEIEELETEGFSFISKKDYEIRKKRDFDLGNKSHERKLLSALFGTGDRVRTSQLKNRFYTHLPRIRNALYEQLTERGGYFQGSPQKVRRFWMSVGAVVMGLAFIAYNTAFVELGGSLALGLTGALAMLFARAMPRRTARGRRAYEEILGFKEFVERVDADRLDRLGGRTPENFEKILPYAVVLGVADEWASAFADIYTEPPSWYRSTQRGAFQPRVFIDDLGQSLSVMDQALKSRPRGSGRSGLGGGGYSGGGFGGGGGGSW